MTAEVTNEVHRGMDAAAAWLLDTERLGETLGGPARASWLRYKPGLSTIASLELDGRSRWIQISSPEHAEKLDKAVRIAARHGWPILIGRVPDSDLRWAHGPAYSDPVLLRAARPTRSAAGAQAIAQWSGGALEVLRYNPRRRMVGRRAGADGGSELIRLNAVADTDAIALGARLVAGGVRVVAPSAVENSGQLSVWPWIDGPGDLARAGDPGLAEQAGAELAALHGVPGGPGPVHDSGVLTGQRQRQLRALAELDPELADRARSVERRVRPVEDGRVRVHGDFSADQVLLDTDGGCLLADLDRCGFGDPRLDLGTFVAVELLEGRDPARAAAFLDGYAERAKSAGRSPFGAAAGTDRHRLASSARNGHPELSHWVAHALLSRLDHPFRRGDPDWRALTEQRIAMAAQVLS